MCNLLKKVNDAVGTWGRRFRRAFSMKSSIFQRNRRLYIKINLFIVALLIDIICHFHPLEAVRSDTGNFITMLKKSQTDKDGKSPSILIAISKRI